MGIKFNCPNGHKLNVKKFLAGKKGVCPHCGAKFRIPNEAGDDDDDPPAPAPMVPVGVAPPMPLGLPAIPAATMPMGAALPAGVPLAGVPAALPMGQPAVPRPVAVAPVATVPLAGAAIPLGAPVGVPVGGMASGIPLPVGGPLAGAPLAGVFPAAVPRVPPAPISDPIAEAPAAVWYVRPPTGSQYGPARGDVMRKWITEGRVSADSLVWREGWPDWKNAGQLFPNLGGAAGAGNSTVSPLGDLPAASRAARSTARLAAKKKGSSGLAIAALVTLGVVCVILVGVLVYVLNQ